VLLVDQGHADLHHVLNSVLNLLPSARYAGHTAGRASLDPTCFLLTSWVFSAFFYLPVTILPMVNVLPIDTHLSPSGVKKDPIWFDWYLSVDYKC